MHFKFNDVSLMEPESFLLLKKASLFDVELKTENYN